MTIHTTEFPDVSANPGVRIETHGCKLNQADSQRLAREMTAAGYRVVGDDEAADVFILNTCTVTHVADRKARQAIRAARRRNPSLFVVATGCYAERAGDDLRSMPEVDLVVGNTGKSALPNILKQVGPESGSVCAVGDDSALSSLKRLRSRAMVKIQEGCDQVCSYCIVPKVRGRERSIPVDEIVATANTYAEMGCQEVVLTGTQLGSYGFDLDHTDIVELLKSLLERTELPRIRVSSLQPQDISDELLELWADPRLCPHFHVPLQSGSDTILKAMRRRYSSAQFLDAVDRVNSAVSGVAVTADAIVGFPGETKADFRDTIATCVAAGLAAVHVFPYSKRPGTSAVYLPEHVEPAARSERARQLGDVACQLKTDFRLKLIGTTRPVLWERSVTNGEHPPTWSGLTDNYVRVTASSADDLTNRITQSTLMGVEQDVMTAEVGI